MTAHDRFAAIKAALRQLQEDSWVEDAQAYKVLLELLDAIAVQIPSLPSPRIVEFNADGYRVSVAWDEAVPAFSVLQLAVGEYGEAVRISRLFRRSASAHTFSEYEPLTKRFVVQRLAEEARNFRAEPEAGGP
jgi:hypothetical protein